MVGETLIDLRHTIKNEVLSLQDDTRANEGKAGSYSQRPFRVG